MDGSSRSCGRCVGHCAGVTPRRILSSCGANSSPDWCRDPTAAPPLAARFRVDISEKCIDWARRHYAGAGHSAEEFKRMRSKLATELGLSHNVVCHLAEGHVYRPHRFRADFPLGEKQG